MSSNLNMLLVYPRHATFALGRVTASNRLQVRCFNLYSLAVAKGSKKAQTLSKALSEWKQLPTEATTGAPPVWLHKDLVIALQREISPTMVMRSLSRAPY